jgi:hypothetical protein
MRLRIAVLTVLPLLLASACGGGSDSGSGDEALKAQTQIDANDQQDAEEIVLRLADFPTGWRAEADDNGDDGAVGACLDVDFSDLTITGKADSDTFVKGNVPVVASVAAVYAEPEQAVTAFDRIATDELAACFSDYMEKQSDDDVTISDASFGKLGFPEMGDESAAYQIAIELEASGLTPTAYVDLVFIQRDRALALLAFVDVFTPFDQQQKEDLAEAVADRMDT